MPQFKVTAPDGTPYMVNAPDGATPEQAIAYAQTLHAGGQGLATPPAAPVAPERPTSQTLGAEEGAMHIFDRAAQGASKIPIVGPLVEKAGEILGLPSTDEAVGAHQQYFSNRENTEKPGETGKIAGEIGATLPLAAITANPIALGAATGALSSDSDTLGGTAVDTAVGGIGGKLGDMALRGIGRVGANLVNRYAPNAVLSAAEAGPKVARQAVDYVSRLLQSSGITHDDLVSAGVQSTKPLTSAEVIGKNGTTALGALARREGTTADTLDGLLKERSVNASGRMLDDYASASGIDPALARGSIDDYVSAGRKTVKPMFDQALSQGPTWNSELAMLSQRPAVRKAMSSAMEDLRNGDIDPAKMGFGYDPVTEQSGAVLRPTAQAWDLVKKNLGQQVERDAFGKPLADSVSPKNFNINKANRDLTQAMRKSIPGYGDALDASGDYLSMQKAFQDGQDFILNPKVTAQQVTKHVSGLSDPEAQAFKGGIANQLFERAQNGRLTGSAFYRAQNGAFSPIPAVSGKLEAALGPENAQNFLANIESEGRMAAASGRMRPGVNSPTSEYNEAMRQQDAGHGVPDELANVAGDILTHGSLPRAAVNSAGRMAKGAVARYQTKGMPVDVRDEAGRLLMMHPKDLGSYLRSIVTAPDSKGADVANRALQWAQDYAAPVAPAISGPLATAGATALLSPSN